MNTNRITEQMREIAAIEALLRARGLPVPSMSAPPALARKIDPADRHLNPYQWARKYRRIDGRRFTLANHKPMRALYEDDHPHIVVMKCAQVGASEMAVTRALHALDVGTSYWRTQKDGLNVAYLFPTGRAMGDFSKERFAPAPREHPHIADLFRGGFDDLSFKQAGASYLYLRSAYVPAGGKKNTAAEQLISFPADVLLLDEYDRMARAAVAMVEKRLRASVVNRQYNISTPTLPGQGIHAMYLMSDQRVWQIPCLHCGSGVVMDFFRDVYGVDTTGRTKTQGPQPYRVWSLWSREVITRADWSVLCPQCQAPLDRFIQGEWVAQQPDMQDIRGYHLPALAFPSVSLAGLAKSATGTDPTQIEEFYRSDLGIPYAASGSTISTAMLDALPTYDAAAPRIGMTLGVDVGARMHYRLSAGPVGDHGERVILAMGDVHGWDALDALLARYPITRCIIDAQPELNATKDFADRHPGKVLRAYYTNDRTQKGELFRVDPDKQVIYINRTMAMDMLYARVADGADFWPKSITQDSEVRAHMTAPSRVTITHPTTGEAVAQWVHTAPDHLFHASLYDQVAAMLRPARRPGALIQGAAKGWNPPT